MAILDKKNANPYRTFTINVNRQAFTKESFRTLQLTAYFHYLKLTLRGAAFTEIEAENARYYIPFSFTIYETMAIVAKHGMKMLYLEIDENSYVEITFDEITIHGTENLYNTCKKVLPLAEQYQVAPTTFYYDFSTIAEWLWNKMLLDQFGLCFDIGEALFGNGYIMLHPIEGDEIEVITQAEFMPYRGKIEYMVVRSNIQDDKVLVIDNITKEAFGCGFDELETVELTEMLRGEQ